MNPSSQGWIAKLGSILIKHPLHFKDYTDLYTQMCLMGFTYGFNLGIPPQFGHKSHFSTDEMAKINLMVSLFQIYQFKFPESSFEDFRMAIYEFYKELEVSDMSIWKRLMSGLDAGTKLEKLLDERVQLNDNPFTRNFNAILANSLLYVDVLTFKASLEEPTKVKMYAAKLEHAIMNLSYEYLNEFADGTHRKQFYDDSVRYANTKNIDFTKAYRSSLNEFTIEERRYLLDLGCMLAWEDSTIDFSESVFLKSLCSDLRLPIEQISDSLNIIRTFVKTHPEYKRLLSQTHPLGNFYGNSVQLVSKLIKRNSKRLIKEIQGSKELMVLLSKSRSRNLTKEEQKKIQNQLLDLIKTIPSLAIFILPGGAILLPIFVRLIPNMLPSAFDDNKINN
ncbi:LETM1-related biofilm-associated protein [Aegicerativicinus sediminis]|uniref:LETM1-related biofilm-associated protein n=1 Tax=Aegicerativicinus sediminis TaxID=2893202 RepID=UPI001E368219|nr:LETM1-related biofilm-associated protein [Aegicerativicinus sediminis]